MAVKTILSRRTFLRGLGASGAMVCVGLPPLEAMFNSSGTAYAATNGTGRGSPFESRFLLWFNGNGIPEKYWIPTETGSNYTLTPCLSPLAPFRNDVHVITGLDNPAARKPGPGNDHHRSMSALVSGTSFTGQGAGCASIDEVIAQKIGGDSRFRSLQIGVCQESFGESIQRNLSWAGRDRPLPPEMIPHKLFNRVFGTKDVDWVTRKRSILDAVREDAAALKTKLGKPDQQRVEEYLGSVRDLERAITSLPPEYSKVEEPDLSGDLKDWPRIAKLQTDLLVHAFAARQTQVASYMLSKCQGLSRFPWLGYTALRHHDYTHENVETPQGMRILRDICKWHVEEFAYLLAKLKSIPEGEATLLDHTCVLFIHEHAEANSHKNNGLAVIAAGHSGGLKTGMHTKMTGTIGDLYWTIADEIFQSRLSGFPTADRKLSAVV
jgi:Protein of unknown function (DUF1552)